MIKPEQMELKSTTIFECNFPEGIKKSFINWKLCWMRLNVHSKLRLWSWFVHDWWTKFLPRSCALLIELKEAEITKHEHDCDVMYSGRIQMIAFFASNLGYNHILVGRVVYCNSELTYFVNFAKHHLNSLLPHTGIGPDKKINNEYKPHLDMIRFTKPKSSIPTMFLHDIFTGCCTSWEKNRSTHHAKSFTTHLRQKLCLLL